MNYIARYKLKQVIILLVPILVYIVPDKLQQTHLKPSMQPYVQFLSRVSHMLPTHVSQRDSQMTPYVAVAHSEKKNALRYTGIYTDYNEIYNPGFWCVCVANRFSFP